MTGRSGDSGSEDPPARAAAPGHGAPVPMESADVQEAGLSEPGRAALSASLGVILGTVLVELGRRVGRGKGPPSR
jgi:hypothetical protein